MKSLYKKALTNIENDPNNPNHRKNALVVGRELVSSGQLTELALSQDIDAACAGATIGEGNVKTIKGAFSSPTKEIERLAKLRNEGIITENEFNIGKNAILNSDRNETDEKSKNLKMLYDLKQQGVITDGEFNIKKWDILSRK